MIPSIRPFPFSALLAALLAALPNAARADAVPVRVIAHNVNLRAAPNPTGDLLGQADYDERLLARDLGGEWVEIEPPASVTGWVKAEYVLRPQNTIGANRVNVRAGSSVNYNIIDTLSLGTPVEPVGELGEWLQIKAPPTARVWISRQFVDLVTAEEPAPAEADATPPAADSAASPASALRPLPPPPPASAPVPPASELPSTTPIVSPSVPERASASGPTVDDDPSAALVPSFPGEIPLPPPHALNLVPLNGQGRVTEVEGILRAAPLINEAPARYRVVRWQGNRWHILCHVYGEAGKLRALKDRRVRVRGREYWIQKASAPVLVPDRIREVPETPIPD